MATEGSAAEAAAAAAGSGNASETPRQMDLGQLSAEQLQSLVQQLDKDVESLLENYSSLKHAEARFTASKNAVDGLGKQKQGDEMLVPLTASMYVPGTLASTEQVIVDVGTGYFADKSVEGAKELLGNKARFLREQTGKLQQHIMLKRGQLQRARAVLQQRTQTGAAPSS